MFNVCYNIDCMAYMMECPDKMFDLAIVDPPYGIGQFLHDNFKYHYKKIKWNNSPPEKKYFNELKRVSKNWIIWGYNYYTDILGNTKRLIVWDKKTSYKAGFSEFEIACHSFTFPGRIVKIDRLNNILKEKKIHPCQKPTALYKWILQNYAKPGWTIFDSHVGSGSIRIACHDLGFNFIGCELDKYYWQAQEERYQNHISHRELFDKEEIQDLIFEQGE